MTGERITCVVLKTLTLSTSLQTHFIHVNTLVPDTEKS